jgi:hypothetical protein
MSAYCPECETDLDQTTGICPACRWDPVIAATTRPVRAPEAGLSLTERYRGTRYDISAEDAVVRSSGVSRGRSFVIVTLVAGVAFYGVVMTMMGPTF